MAAIDWHGLSEKHVSWATWSEEQGFEGNRNREDFRFLCADAKMPASARHDWRLFFLFQSNSLPLVGAVVTKRTRVRGRAPERHAPLCAN